MSQIILARIQRCRYCRREMSSPPLDYQQNPFCANCLRERVSNATPAGRVRWRKEGDYIIAEASRKHPSSGRKRPAN
jgi:hypothetical protein